MVEYLNGDEFDRRGFELLDQGRYEDAVRFFKEAIALCPYHADLRCGLGQAYGEMGEYYLAARAFNDGLRLSPDDEEMWFGLGLCFLKLNRLSEADGCFHYVERRLLKDPDAMLHLAFSYYQIEMPEKAVDYSRRVLTIDPDNAEALAMLGVSLQETGEPLDAVKSHIERAIALEPSRWDWVEYYANLLYEDGDRAKAFTYFDRIPLADIRNPDSFKRLARLLRKHRRDPQKIRECQRLAKEAARDDTFEGFLYSLQEDLEKVDE